MSEFITVTNSEFHEVLKTDAAEGLTNWTISQYARRGDIVWLYVTRPVMAIVAMAIVSGTPKLDQNPNSEWFGFYLADLEDLVMLRVPITRASLLQFAPTWGYWRQPRQSVQVPAEFEDKIWEIGM
ncbi:MAG: hypothetical protein ABIP75_03190 [Pyrinomonadaceae bacterium]